MSLKCELTGTLVQYGNNVSHSNRKTRRSFKPNIHSIIYTSNITNKNYKLKIVARAMRTIEKFGGFDMFFIKTNTYNLSLKAKRIKKEINNKYKQQFYEEKNTSTLYNIKN